MGLEEAKKTISQVRSIKEDRTPHRTNHSPCTKWQTP